MRSWVRGRISLASLVLAFCIAIAGLLWAEHQKHQEEQPYYPQQIEAAQVMGEAIGRLRVLREKLGISIDPEADPNRTGLIGAEMSELTTSIGVLEAKRTAINPAFAALVVHYFQEAGLKEGDLVAIGASGSFPSLILATLAACRGMDLEPLVIYSLGSSMYGANIIGFTFVEMLAELKAAEILPYDLLAVSPGGDDDRAAGMLSEFTPEDVAKLADRYGVSVILADSVPESIAIRRRLYREAAAPKTISCFVNIGGAAVNYGNTPASLRFPNGLVSELTFSSEAPDRGLIFDYALQGLPVINLLNIKDLAAKNGLPIDPIPLPPIGSGGIYYRTSYPKWPIFLTLALLVAVLVKKKQYLEK